MSTQIDNRTAEDRADSPAPGGSEVWIGHNEPNTRGLLQDIQTAMIKDGSYVLTPHEVEIVYLALARLHDLESFGYQRDWEGITNYCPRTDDPQNGQAQRPPPGTRSGSGGVQQNTQNRPPAERGGGSLERSG